MPKTTNEKRILEEGEVFNAISDNNLWSETMQKRLFYLQFQFSTPNDTGRSYSIIHLMKVIFSIGFVSFLIQCDVLKTYCSVKILYCCQSRLSYTST